MAHDLVHLGAVLLPAWSLHPVRVLAFDDREVLCDRWNPDTATWASADLQATSIYGRVERTSLDGAAHLRTEPLSHDERLVHRPDLPITLASASLAWPDPPELAAFRRHLLAIVPPSTLDVSSLYLSTFRGDAIHDSVLVGAADGAPPLAVHDLFLRAATLQAPLLEHGRPNFGIGLFRLGIENGLPSYYPWGFRSKADPSEHPWD